MSIIHELDVNRLRQYLIPRPKESHKGDFGQVLIIGGALGYSGAVKLAGEAALRVGAGTISIATHPQHALFLDVSCPELMCHGVSNARDLDPLLEKSSTIVIGPGLGTNKWSLSLLKIALNHKNKPMILDADALNLLAITKIKMNRNNCIFTPHPGEGAKLLNMTPKQIQDDRLSAIKKLHELLGGVVVLKGNGTLIQSKRDEIDICHAGNPGMATAGMGDVLTGIIAGFAAQHIPLDNAAKLGVLIHGTAGDLSASKKGERGMIATDLISELRKLVNN